MRFLNQPLPATYARPVVGLDLETSMRTRKKTSDPFTDQILSAQVSDGENSWIITNPDLFVSVAKLVERPDVVKVLHNATFDLQFIMHQLKAVPCKDALYDSLLTERVLNSGRSLSNSLDDTLARRMGVMLDKATRESFKNHQGEFTERQLNYMEQDVLYLPRLYDLQMMDVSKTATGRVVRLENRLVTATTRMILKGICFDKALWPEYKKEIEKVVAQIEGELTTMLNLGGQQDLFGNVRLGFNPESTKQARRILNDAGIDVEDTNEKTLTYFMDRHPNHEHLPLIIKIVEHREWRKRLGWSYQDEIHPVTGRIHATWNQVGADTGRFSCKDPNLQNVPKPEEGKPNFRKLFPPAEGYLFAVVDFNQQEPRILAQMSGDTALRAACNSGDIYIAMGELIYGQKLTKADPRRYDLKQVVLSDFYGASAETISQNKHVPVDKVEIIKARSRQLFSQTHSHMGRVKNMASIKGVTRTLLGRPRFYEEIEQGHEPRKGFWNEAVNHPVQGSGADVLKMGLDYFDDVCMEHAWDACQVGAIHDELIAEAPPSIMDEVYFNLIGSMEKAGRELCPDVPLIADGVISERWDKT